jgi:hypothetical protein
MMRRSTALTTALLIAMGVLSPLGSLHAQLRPFRIGVGGGPAMPLGASGDQLVLGWNALGTLAISVPTFPVGLRLDAAYNQFDFERALIGSGGPPGAERVISFTVNPVIKLPTEGELVTPYFVAGAGSYAVGCTESSSACKSSTNFGWNVGGGANFQLFGLRAFAEARYHRSSQGNLSIQYLPLTLGLLF